jgi:peptide/nickel transport system substrate-binding protein
MRNVLGGVILMAAIGAGAAPASAQKSADTLRITWRDAVPDVTPYYNQLRTGLVIGHQVWDSLV